MKTYLCFYNDGETEELKTLLKNKDDVLSSDTITNYSNNNIIEFKNNSFLICYNNITSNINTEINKNICKIPFINFETFGKYIIFKLDSNNNIINFTNKQLLKLIDFKIKNQETDYSSDDFD